jgi:hypothetical protein
MRNQDWGEGSDRARAADAINQWNAAQSADVQGRNAGLYNTYYNQTADRAKMRANAYQAQAGQHSGNAQQALATGAGVGQAAGQLAAGLGAYYEGQQAQPQTGPYPQSISPIGKRKAPGVL